MIKSLIKKIFRKKEIRTGAKFFFLLRGYFAKIINIFIKRNLTMAVPKRKTSKSRRNKRRSHHRLVSANIIEDKRKLT